MYDSEYSDEPTHQALFHLLVMHVGAAVPRGPTARAVPPGTDVPACADHIAEERITVVDLAVLLVIRENLLTEHEIVAAVPVFDRNEPRHAGQGDQQTAETVVVQLPVLGEQRHPSAAILPPEVPAVEDDLTLVNDDHGLTLNADFVMLQRVFYQPLGGQLGVTNGMADGTFGVNNTCTRGQSVTFLYRALGTAPSTVNGFTDVAADSFCADAVAWAVENGVTNGTSATTFSPNNGCTRAQIVTFLYRAYQGK